MSTAGLVPEIRRLADEKLSITLAISLHAPNDTIRNQLMPINNTYPIEQVVAAGDYYAHITGRRVTYEYILISGVNDSPDCARELAKLMRGRLAAVNLIPLNQVVERRWERPPDQVIWNFEKTLRSLDVNVTVRKEMGPEISAACGQLRNQKR